MSISRHTTHLYSLHEINHYHCLADLYAYDGDGPIPRQVTDPGVRKIADFPIQIPHLPGVRAGDRVDLQIDFVFASTELRIEVLVKGQRMSFTSKLDSEDA